MGPDSAQIVNQLGVAELNSLGYFQHQPVEIAGVPVEAVRLSYVGEAGWEFTCATDQAGSLFKALSLAGAKPSGIFAQTSMRIEKQFLAYGHDLDTDINPFQAGLGFAIDWDSDFIGKQALAPMREKEPKSRMVSIILNDQNAIPLGNEPVYADGQIIGKTTSAAFGYRVAKPVALAQIKTITAQPLDGLSVEVDIARNHFSGTMSLACAYDPEGLRMRNPPLTIKYD